jgi:hypothetical protein
MTIITLLKPPHVFSETISLTALFDIVNGGVGDASSNVNESSAAIMSLVVARLYKGIGHGNKNRLCFLGRALLEKVCAKSPLSCKLADLAAGVNSGGRFLFMVVGFAAAKISAAYIYHAKALLSLPLNLWLGWKTALRKFHYRVGFPFPAAGTKESSAHTFEISLKIHQQFQIHT